jgi:hypothetical protein
MKRLVISVSLAMLVSACGSSSTSPVAATPPIPQYGGSWTGSYVITGCNQSGGVAAANICGTLGSSAPYTFSLTQSSRNVSGSFALGTVGFPNTGGTVGQDGSLALSATTVNSGITIVVNWALNMPAAAITGTIAQIWTSNVLSGQVNVVGSISTATRTSSLARSLTFQPRSVQELLNGLTSQQ